MHVHAKAATGTGTLAGTDVGVYFWLSVVIAPQQVPDETCHDDELQRATAPHYIRTRLSRSSSHSQRSLAADMPRVSG